MTKQEHEISKALAKIIEVHEEIAHKGLDESLCSHWAKEMEQPIRNIKQALNVE